VRSGDIEAVSMESVAEKAGVSRPLVYKHFANRGELLVEIYRREAAVLYRELADEVEGATSLEEMYRTLLRGSLRAAADRGHVFAALRTAGGWTRQLRNEQRSRDRATVRAFSARAVHELRIDRARATAATVVLLGAIDSVLSRWRRHPTAENAHLLEDIYMGMVAGGYHAAAPAAKGSVDATDATDLGPLAPSD
jgi:AcrR family transcriptional regulator